MARSAQARLADYEARYRELAGQLAEIGYITAGSITSRHTRCASPRCRCHADPPQPHGPYWQWTTKASGKTITRRLSPNEAECYRQWIANDRELRAIVSEMRKVAAKATNLILTEDKKNQAEV